MKKQTMESNVNSLKDLEKRIESIIDPFNKNQGIDCYVHIVKDYLILKIYMNKKTYLCYHIEPDIEAPDCFLAIEGRYTEKVTVHIDNIDTYLRGLIDAIYYFYNNYFCYYTDAFPDQSNY